MFLDNGGREMKKLMVLLFVLALVNVANAGYVDLVISSVGPSETETTPLPQGVDEIWILPSMWVDIDVVYFPEAQGYSGWSLSKEMVITGPAEASIASITWPTLYWNMEISNVTLLPSGNPLLNTFANNIGSVPGGIVLDHFLIHCTGPEDVKVALVENPNTSAGESLETDGENLYHLGEGLGVTIHQPEPMTLTLLGLGSLFLARRKK